MLEILLPLAPSLVYWWIRQRDAHTVRRLFRRIGKICAYKEVQRPTHRVAVVVVMDEADRAEIISLVAELLACGRKRGVPWFIKYLDVHTVDEPDCRPQPILANHLQVEIGSPRIRRFGLFKREKRRDLNLLQRELARIIPKYYSEPGQRAQTTAAVCPSEQIYLFRKESRDDLVRQQQVELGETNGRVRPRKAA